MKATFLIKCCLFNSSIHQFINNMKIPKQDLVILLSGLLILIFAFVHPALAQNNPEKTKKVKKIIIIENIIDENGNKKTTRIEKEGQEAEAFELEKLIEDKVGNENSNKNLDKIIKEIEINGNKEGETAKIFKQLSFKVDSLAAKRPFLGVELDENVIENVVENSPAERAGLKQGDKILAINADKINGYDDLTAALSKYKPDATVAVKYEREGKAATTNVVLAKKTATMNYTSDEFRMMDDGCCRDKWSETFKELKDRPKLGVEIGQNNNLKGALITKVYEKSGAADAGLQQGDIIYEMNAQPITNDKDLTDMVRSHKGGEVLKIKYRRDGEKRETEATLGKNTDMIEKIFKEDDRTTTTRKTVRKGGNDSGLQLENYEFYPNPTQNSIKLKFSSESNQALSIRLVDANGKEIYQEEIKDFNKTYDKSIDLTGKPEGVYVLTIMQGGQVFSRQLVYAKK
jgi:C-terminal processing protease CtpA/Prc